MYLKLITINWQNECNYFVNSLSDDEFTDSSIIELIPYISTKIALLFIYKAFITTLSPVFCNRGLQTEALKLCQADFSFHKCEKA